MAKIGLIDVDKTGFPNIALGKVATYHNERLSAFRDGSRVRIVGQPYRDFNNPNQIIPQWQKDMARWAMRREIYASCDFKDYEPRKGFKCKEYFK